MARIIACANQKGGVGKTTTSFNLCDALARLGKRTLLVDLDPQGNATATFGLDMEHLPLSVADLLLQQETHPRHAIYCQQHFHLMPSNLGLEYAALNLHTARMREFRLEQQLQHISDNYEYIVIDCPPSIGILTENALAAADRLIIPVDIGFYALVGVTQILGAMREIQESTNPHLRLGGILATKHVPGQEFSESVLGKLRSNFRDQAFRTAIRQCGPLAEAPSHGKSIFDFDPASDGAYDYNNLAQELLAWEH